MNYLPDLTKIRLKDSWVFVDGDVVHLFYLAENPENSLVGRLFGHAVSRDWLHWETLEPIDPKGEGDAWDAGTPGTGHVFQYDDGKYYMAYTGRRGEGGEQVEHISVMVSDDLCRWEKLSDEPIWPCPSGSPYESNTRVPRAAWRDPVIVKNPEGKWQAFCAARLDEGPMTGRGCVARADILSPTKWQTVAPLEQPWEFSVMEVPEVFELNGKVWMLFSTGGYWWGQQIHTRSRQNILGTFYLVADAWDGPFRRPEENLLIGAGGGRVDGYVARVVRYGDELLCYHHYHGQLRALGMPKVIRSEGDELYLTPWEGVTQLYKGHAEVSGWRELGPGYTGLTGTGRWDDEGKVIRGESAWGGSVSYAAGVGGDVDVSARVTVHGDAAGILTAMHEGQGFALVMDAAHGELRVGFYGGQGAYGPVLGVPLDKVRFAVERGRAYEVRMIQRERFCDIFVDDRWQFSTGAQWDDRGAGLGLYVENGGAEFVLDAVQRLEPLTVSAWTY